MKSMKIQITKTTEDEIQFKLTQTTIAFANSLRRTLLSDIPVLAIERVEIEKNFTVIPDEMLAHRLGLVPIDSKTMLKSRKDCDCDNGCIECEIRGSIDVSNKKDEILCVTSNDLIFHDETKNINRRFPTLIAKLSNRQSIKLNFYIARGTAAIHSKFCPVTVVNYEYDAGNRMRHADYWHENNIEMEWPNLKQEEPDLVTPISEIEMGFEVIEGVLEPIEVLVRALDILKAKVEDIKNHENLK